MSLASVAAQQSALAAAESAVAQNASTQSSAGAASSASGATSSQQASQNALTALSGNFQDFLGMLMTQLQNQDPTSPLDSNQFTQELVEFSGVEQQISTNNSLTQLIQLTQSGELMQAAAMTGKQVQVQSSQIPLQNGQGSVRFTLAAAEPVAIAIANAAGTVVKTAIVSGQAGANTWTWNGQTDAGTQLPDGAYQISVYGAGANGNTAPVPFTVGGTVTGTTSSSTNGLQLQLGAESVGFGAVQSMGN
ncbi:MAG TPA: flagellar hook capping FlgD N-terminal domain-containing protein [Acetobacteraceae bacterium]|nr:flagellar hook capping FlgD N-terminal domain-containing protein [Acetobacteraceae bacterium]